MGLRIQKNSDKIRINSMTMFDLLTADKKETHI